MDKYIIKNEDFNSIICKPKNGGRHYRQNMDNIDKNLIIVQTSKRRAEAERDYLNKEYNSGWEIEKVQPIIFTDNEKTHEEYLTEYATLRKSEIEEVRKTTAKELYNKAKGCVEIAYFESKISVKARDYINKLLLYAMKECGVDIVDAE